ncbi:MAG: STAS/SEC14 domain-containing protein [Rickettsiales bacterium]|nr:STAS/SEC14 domain-containing protein [Rickettsiales bacterium]
MNSNQITQVTFKEFTSSNGLFCQFDDQNGVLLLDVKNSFNEEDFIAIADLINPYFQENGELRGVIINSKKFPYWSGAQNRNQYINFASENHHKFNKAALVMNGFFTKIVARIARGRVHPEVKIFKYNQIVKAQSWILSEMKLLD